MKALHEAKQGQFVRFADEDDFWEVLERLPRYIALMQVGKDRGVSRGSKFWNAPVDIVSDAGLYEPDEAPLDDALSQQELAALIQECGLS
jgi:hypothetical protein